MLWSNPWLATDAEREARDNQPVECPDCGWLGLLGESVLVPLSVAECPRCRAYVQAITWEDIPL